MVTSTLIFHSVTFISSMVFIFLNIIENVIHYSNGINKQKKNIFSLETLDKNDWKKIIGIMLIFALLQGTLTSFIYNWVSRK